MFPTKEAQDKPSRTDSTSKELSFKSIDQFASWLDVELETLVDQFADFETDKSVRKFFTRS